MCEARHGRCAGQARADARDKAGQMRGARQGRKARQGLANARGKAGQMRVACRQIREARHGRCETQGG
jgi:hypothetical protein